MRIKKTILGISVLIALGAVGLSVLSKEKLLHSAETILFELAPVDPRSIMQGDYMTLRYSQTQGVEADALPARGYMVFSVDSLMVARAVRFQKHQKPLGPGERIIKYFVHAQRVSIGAESFFFQEGDAALYGQAHFGGIKVAKNGESILQGLFDEKRSEIIKH